MEHFMRALDYSAAGFRALLRERAFRQELTLLGVALMLTLFFRGCAAFLNVLPWGLLILIVEALNTAIEKTVDLCTQEIHPLAKTAKDAASFACSIAIGVFLIQTMREFLR